MLSRMDSSRLIERYMKRVEQFILLFVACLIGFLLFALVFEVPRDELIATPFDVPSEIKEFTGRTVAERLVDKINNISSPSSTSYAEINKAQIGPASPREPRRAKIAPQEGLTIKMEVGGISLDSFVSYIKKIFKFLNPLGIVGKREVISGNVIQNGNNITIVSRTDEGGPWVEEGEQNNLDTILANLAEQMAFDLASNTKEYSQLANFYSNRGKYEKAELIYRKITEQNPNAIDAEIYIDWANLLLKMQEYEEAKCKYKQACEIACVGNMRKYCFENEKYEKEKKIKCLDFTPSINPIFTNPTAKTDCADVIVDWGVGLSKMYNQNAAIEMYEKAEEIDSKNPKVYSEWGYELYLQKNYEKADKLFQKSSENCGDDAEWGYDLRLLGKNEEFINNCATFYSGWGIDLYALKNYEDSIEKFKKAIKLDPESYWDYYNWGLDLYSLALAFKQDNYPNEKEYIKDKTEYLELSISKYKQALRINPKYVNAYISIGLSYDALAKYEEAMKQYEKAIEINPDDYLPYYNWGTILTKIGKYSEANEKYKKATELNPDYDSAYYNWGLNLYKLSLNYPDGSKESTQYLESSISKYRQALSINPKYVNACINIGLSYVALGKYEEAMKQYEKAIEINPDDYLPYYNWGTILTKIGKYSEANEKYKKATEIDPNFALAYYNWGDALRAENKKEEAAEKFKKFLELSDLSDDKNRYLEESAIEFLKINEPHTNKKQ